MSAPARPYLSNGQVLQSPPFSARVRNFIDGSYAFFGLYITTLFSLDPYSAAQQSQFNTVNRNRAATGSRTVSRPGAGGGGGGGGGGGSGGGSGGGGGRKVGTVDDIRGPECKSCG